MLRRGVVAAVAGLGLVWWSVAGAEDGPTGGDGAAGVAPAESVLAGQDEIARIEREVADLDAIRKAQEALIEYRRAGADPGARLDRGLCVRSVLRALCDRLEETFGHAVSR